MSPQHFDSYNRLFAYSFYHVSLSGYNGYFGLYTWWTIRCKPGTLQQMYVLLDSVHPTTMTRVVNTDLPCHGSRLLARTQQGEERRIKLKVVSLLNRMRIWSSLCLSSEVSKQKSKMTLYNYRCLLQDWLSCDIRYSNSIYTCFKTC